MTNRNHTPQSLPVANYSPAIARAVAWLGDRYLLASPINASSKQASTAGHDARLVVAQRATVLSFQNNGLSAGLVK